MFAGDLRRRGGQGRLPGRARRHLPAPDAAAQAAAGTERRRVRGDGLPRGPRGPRHHRRSARPGHHAALARHLADPGPGAQPRRRRARTGRSTRGPATAFYRNYFHMFADRSMPDAYERSLPEVFPDFAPGNFTYDEESSSWVWTTFNSWQWDLNWAQPRGLLRVRGPDLLAGQPRRGVPAAGRDRLHLQADRHQLPEPARGARDHPGAAYGGPDRRPGVDLQGRGDRRAGGPGALPRGRQARRQGQRPGVPELADGADLVGAGGQGHPAVLRRDEPVPGQAADDGVGHLPALSRRHRLGDQRRGRRVGRAERLRAPAVPRRLLRRARIR